MNGRSLSVVSVFVFLFISSVQGCKDNASNCAAWKANGFCSSPFFDLSRRLMSCAMTCGLCEVDSGSSESASTEDSASTGGGAITTPRSTATCKDSTPSCAAWAKNGYCSSIFYSAEIKKQKCPKSCNLC